MEGLEEAEALCRETSEKAKGKEDLTYGNGVKMQQVSRARPKSGLQGRGRYLSADAPL